jgi:hypothetical protein
VLSKDDKRGKVTLQALVRTALDQYLVRRGLPVTPVRWNPATPLVASLDRTAHACIESTRFWRVQRRFFVLAADASRTSGPRSQKSCAALACTGRGTRTRHMRWRGGTVSVPDFRRKPVTPV